MCYKSLAKQKVNLSDSFKKNKKGMRLDNER